MGGPAGGRAQPRHILEDRCRQEMTGTAAIERSELADWLLRMADPVGGWQCFHTASYSPRSSLGWAWRPEQKERDGNMPPNEWAAMDRYRRFMHERARRKISWVAAIERNPDWSGVNKGWHVHGMWTAESDIWRRTSGERWLSQWGSNKLKKITGGDYEVAEYLGKYALNELCLVEWEVNGGLWHIAQRFVRAREERVLRDEGKAGAAAA